jgi:putative flippase GtrA
MNIKKQYLLYFLFAIISTFLNLAVQKIFELVFLKAGFYHQTIIISSALNLGLFIQMGLATIAGFIFKYLADKILIFKDKTSYLSGKHFSQIFIYGLFAVLTTVIFWSTEILFKYFLNFNNSEYAGAFLGLAVGYTVKFFLDRKFVFNKKK